MTVSDTVAWVDPFVGGRIFIPLDKKWYLGLRGDIGGFGIGNASDLALNGNVFYQLADQRALFIACGLSGLLHEIQFRR